MQADTYIPRRLDDPWKIGFWDVDVAAPLLFGLFMGYMSGSKFSFALCLAAGASAGAPYDVLFIDGAVEEVPAALVQQLVDGGRVVTGVVERGVARLCSGRAVAGVLGLASLADMEMVVLPGFAAPEQFVF
mgnify:CR=1 FL=1